MKNLFTSLALFTIINSYAQVGKQIELQSDFRYKYYATINTHILEEYECDLVFDKMNSLFVWHKVGDTSLQVTDDGGYTSAEHLRDSDFEFLDKENNNLISKDFISRKEFYYIKQVAPKLTWNITNITKEIGGFECVKATTQYGGRGYIAWYTPSIAVSYGPWKISGLPGLILEVYDTDKEIFLTLKEIKKDNTPLKVSIEKDNFISLKDFYQRKVDYPFEILKVMQARASKGSTISISSIKRNFIEKEYEILTNK